MLKEILLIKEWKEIDLQIPFQYITVEKKDIICYHLVVLERQITQGGHWYVFFNFHELYL